MKQSAFDIWLIPNFKEKGLLFWQTWMYVMQTLGILLFKNKIFVKSEGTQYTTLDRVEYLRHIWCLRSVMLADRCSNIQFFLCKPIIFWSGYGLKNLLIFILYIAEWFLLKLKFFIFLSALKTADRQQRRQLKLQLG